MAQKKLSVTGLTGTDTADYTAAAASTAQKAANALKTAAGRTRAGYERLRARTARDYDDLTTRRNTLAAADGDRGSLGTAQAGSEAISRQNALGILQADQAETVSGLTAAADSLAAKADSKAAAAEAQQEALLQELAIQEAQRSATEARTEYEQQQADEQASADTAQSQADARTTYLRELGLICLQLGYVPGDDMLDALGIDAATAKSFAKYYWKYGY